MRESQGPRCVGAQIGVARRAADRLSAKLEEAVAAGRAVEMEEEFRLLTLQVIGEAVLSLPPEECDRVRCPLPTGSRQTLQIVALLQHTAGRAAWSVTSRALASIPVAQRASTQPILNLHRTVTVLCTSDRTL